jgi:hypothetical protein
MILARSPKVPAVTIANPALSRTTPKAGWRW